MEGEKERRRQQGEEKESNEAEDDTRSDEDDDANNEDTGGAWQETYSQDNLCIPIMHWEALSLHIAELEKQEEEEKKKSVKDGASLERGRAAVSWRDERGRRVHGWEEGDAPCSSPVLALTSRLQTQMNLQLCFINNSESEEEEEEEGVEPKEEEALRTKGSSGAARPQKSVQASASSEKPRTRGLRSALRNLRERLRSDQRALTTARGGSVCDGRRLERSDLQSLCTKELRARRAGLSKSIQDLSSELVSRLQVRDELRMEQDAMLLELQDLTSV